MLNPQRNPRTVLIGLGVIYPHTPARPLLQMNPALQDAPVPGAIQWLETVWAEKRLNPIIITSIASEQRGISALRQWLRRYHFSGAGDIKITNEQPNFWVRICERCIVPLPDNYPSIDDLLTFQRPLGPPSEKSFEDVVSDIAKQFAAELLEHIQDARKVRGSDE